MYNELMQITTICLVEKLVQTRIKTETGKLPDKLVNSQLIFKKYPNPYEYKMYANEKNIIVLQLSI